MLYQEKSSNPVRHVECNESWNGLLPQKQLFLDARDNIFKALHTRKILHINIMFDFIYAEK
jgi:hypothetical protein